MSYKVGGKISATEDGVTRYFVFDGLDVIAELSQASRIKDACLAQRHEVTKAAGPAAAGRTNVERLMSNVRRLGFSTKEYDAASGISYYGFRYYDPHSARWMTKEPSGADGPNQYWFVWNTPVQLVDFRGLEAIYPQPVPPKISYIYKGIFHKVYFGQFGEYSLSCCIRHYDEMETKIGIAGVAVTTTAAVLSMGKSALIQWLVIGGSALLGVSVSEGIDEVGLCTGHVYVPNSVPSNDDNLSLNQPPRRVSITMPAPTPTAPLRHPVWSRP